MRASLGASPIHSSPPLLCGVLQTNPSYLPAVPLCAAPSYSTPPVPTICSTLRPQEEEETGEEEGAMANTAAMLCLGLLPGRRTPPSKLFPKATHKASGATTTLPGAETSQSPPHQLFPELQQSLFQALSPVPAAAAASSVFTLSSFFSPEDALAVGGEFGLLEGRTLSLVHPIVMGGLFLHTLWTGYLGWQWRRVRTIQDEINEFKKQVKPVPTTAVLSSGAEAAPPSPAPPSPVETKIQLLTEERKALLKGSYRERHFNAGSILLAFGVFEAVGGCLNTWFRTGKLFPGPHLFAGATITVLWALAASLVPAMQKGNESARNLHIALNALNVTLFVSQIPTGIEIVFKVLEFTTWP